MSGADLATHTLAELYRKQGHIARAREIYRVLLQRDAADERARRALDELGSDAMGFKEHLEKVVTSVDGALACSVMGFDGIPIETHEVSAGGDMDVKTMLIEFSGIINQIRQAAEMLQTGKVSEVSINTERILTIARLLTPEYFVVLALKPEGNYGKGRYVLRVAAPKLQAEF